MKSVEDPRNRFLVSSWTHLGVEIGIRVALVVAILIVEFTLKPHERILNQMGAFGASFPHQNKESFTIIMASVYALIVLLVVPLIVFAVTDASFAHGRRTKLWIREVNIYFAEVSLTVLCTYLIVSVVKNYIGRPRPDYLSRCYGISGMEAVELYLASKTCTSSHKSTIEEGLRSFPSGHAGLSGAVFTTIALWAHYKLKRLDRPYSSLCILVPYFAILLGIVICVSRARDYMHNPTDILAGGFIGVSTSLIIHYSMYRLPPSWPQYKIDPGNEDDGYAREVHPARDGDRGHIDNSSSSVIA